MQHLETCLLIAEVDRVLCHLVMFLNCLFYWMGFIDMDIPDSEKAPGNISAVCVEHFS